MSKTLRAFGANGLCPAQESFLPGRRTYSVDFAARESRSRPYAGRPAQSKTWLQCASGVQRHHWRHDAVRSVLQ